MFKYFILIVLAIVSSCGDKQFEDNLFEYKSEQEAVPVTPFILFNLSKDSVEAGSSLLFYFTIENITIDSMKFSFDGDTIMDKSFSNYVKVLPYIYNTRGTYLPKIKIYSQDTVIWLSSKIEVVEKGFWLPQEIISVDSTDSVEDHYVEDSTLSIGSAPLIAFLGGVDTLLLSANDSFVDPGAIAFDDEDGEIKTVITAYDSILLALPIETLQPQVAFIHVKVTDSHGNSSERERVCIIKNENYRLNFDLSTEEDTIIDSYNQNRLIKNTDHYLGIDYPKLDTGSVSILVQGYFKDSDTTQSIFSMTSGKKLFLQLNQNRDSLEFLIRNQDDSVETIHIENTIPFDEPVKMILSIGDNTFSIFVNGSGVFSKPLKDSYVGLYNSTKSVYNLFVLSDENGGNISTAQILNFQLYNFLISHENILEF